MKRALQVLALLAVLASTLAVPTHVWADGIPWPHVSSR